MPKSVYNQCIGSPPLPMTSEVWDYIVDGQYVPYMRQRVRKGHHRLYRQAGQHRYLICWRNVALHCSTFWTVEDDASRYIVDGAVFKNSKPGRIVMGEFKVDEKRESAEMRKRNRAIAKARQHYPYLEI